MDIEADAISQVAVLNASDIQSVVKLNIDQTRCSGGVGSMSYIESYKRVYWDVVQQTLLL